MKSKHLFVSFLPLSLLPPPPPPSLPFVALLEIKPKVPGTSNVPLGYTPSPHPQS